MGLTRRRFLAGTAALASVWGVSREVMGRALAAPLRIADGPTTLLQTIRMSSQPVRGDYRTLLAG
ncbi:MAG: TIGR03767 family metallophosphoesterase, partial [Candidatus Nanopelagicales bacterium]